MSLVFLWTVHLFRSFWNAACNSGCDQQVIEKPPPAGTQVSVSTCTMKNPTQETPGKQFFTSGDSADGCSRLVQVSSSANFCFTAQKILQLSLRSSSSLTSISASPLKSDLWAPWLQPHLLQRGKWPNGGYWGVFIFEKEYELGAELFFWRTEGS